MSRLLYLMVVLFLNNLCIANNNYNWSIFRNTLYSSLINCDHSKDQNRGISEVQVFFYDFQNNVNLSYPIDWALEGITSSYNMDVSKKIVFFVPGYKSHITKTHEEMIRQTFKQVSNLYLIIIDHSVYTTGKGGTTKSYERSVSFAYYIGKALGDLLAGLHRYGFPSKKIHCVGHSLGAQILGYAGVTYFNRTSEKIGRITGIDPAGPCFSNALIDEQIRSGVADYVEVYHCNAGGLGTTAVLADTDFFLNERGKTQPDCRGSLIPGYGEFDSSKCSHKACVKYWAASVLHIDWYEAVACNSYEDYVAARCFGNQRTIAGYWNPGNATGIFYASTGNYPVV